VEKKEEKKEKKNPRTFVTKMTKFVMGMGWEGGANTEVPDACTSSSWIL